MEIFLTQTTSWCYVPIFAKTKEELDSNIGAWLKSSSIKVINPLVIFHYTKKIITIHKTKDGFIADAVLLKRIKYNV